MKCPEGGRLGETGTQEPFQQGWVVVIGLLPLLCQVSVFPGLILRAPAGRWDEILDPRKPAPGDETSVGLASSGVGRRARLAFPASLNPSPSQEKFCPSLVPLPTQDSCGGSGARQIEPSTSARSLHGRERFMTPWASELDRVYLQLFSFFRLHSIRFRNFFSYSSSP